MNRFQIRIRLLTCVICLGGGFAHADLFDLDGNLIAGTEGVELRRGVDLDGIDLGQVSLVNTEVVANALSEQQVYQTASYQAKNLTGVQFQREKSLWVIPYRLEGWNFSEQRLVDAGFEFAEASTADFSSTDLLRANFGHAVLKGASLAQANAFQTDFFASDLTNANLTGANLSGADLRTSNLARTDFSNSKLQNASLRFSTGFRSATFNSTVQYNQWTEFPLGFDAAAVGMTLVESPAGDFDGDGDIDDLDIDELSARLRRDDDIEFLQVDEFGDGFVVVDLRFGDFVYASNNIVGGVSDNHPILLEYGVNAISTFDAKTPEMLEGFLAERRRATNENAEWLERMFDLNRDDGIDQLDLDLLLNSIGALPGDANLDGRINFTDFLALSANFGNAAGWRGGDFDHSGEVGFEDFVLLSANFSATSAANPVPEPSRLMLVSLLMGIVARRRRQT